MRKLLIALLTALLALCGTALADEGIAFDARTAAVTAATAGGDIAMAEHFISSPALYEEGV